MHEPEILIFQALLLLEMVFTKATTWAKHGIILASINAASFPIW
jgi:hypothetical protein